MSKQIMSLARQDLRKRQKESERRLQEQLTPLIEVLTGSDDCRRRAVAEHISQAWPPAVLAGLLDLLVGLLGRGGEAARRQAIASLAEFGHRALPALTLRFQRSRRAAVQLDIVAALQQLAPGLSRNQQTNLMTELAIVAAFAADAAVCYKVAETIAILRASSEPGTA
jgi:HEAT repeat protein